VDVKLILTQEVSGLGSPGDVVEVKDGYGRNYLVPRGLAIRWTKGGEKQVSQIRRARDARDIRDLGQAQELRAAIEGRQVRLTARAGSGGRLFGSITAADIVHAVRAAGGPELDRRRIEMPGHIKTTGSHTAMVRLHPEVSAKITLEVVAS
jgi:large subunit ribosomal protein L9